MNASLRMFNAGKQFSDLQIDLMITEIADILGKLRENGVYDFDREKAILLLHRDATHIEFEKTELMEIKRFIALVKQHIGAITYLTRKMRFVNTLQEREREDRIMGAINYGKTIQLRQREALSNDKAICIEIQRSFDTPENRLLALVLLSIVAYCDKYLVKNGEMESGTRIDMHTLSTLQLIQQYTVSLMTTRSLKQIMSYAMSSAQDYDSLLKLMMNRIYQGKIPNYFANILKLFYEWRYLKWVTSKNTELTEHMLRYYFFNTKKPYLLYECWVFYKILDIIVDNFKIKFKESGTSGTTFVSDDGSIKVIYQKRYKAKWLKKGQEMYEYPDIIIEFKNGLTIVVDAKDAEYISSKHNPYRRQIDDYMGYAKARVGVLIFSRGDEELWDDLLTEEGNNAAWITLTPSLTGDKDATNNKNLQKLMQQGINCHNNGP
jgi:hypothetical protein